MRKDLEIYSYLKQIIRRKRASKEDERHMILSLIHRIEINVLKEKYDDSLELTKELENHINLMKRKYNR